MALQTPARGALTVTPNTAIESTAALRYVRAAFFNSGTSTRTVTVRLGAGQVVKKFTLAPDEDRIVGPHILGAAETFQAWQDVGTDVTYNTSAET